MSLEPPSDPGPAASLPEEPTPELGWMERIPELETSSMLVTPTLEEHQRRMATLFQPGDRVLDVGAGDYSFVRLLRSRGVVAEGCTRNERMPAGYRYNTLHLSESVGYLGAEVFAAYVHPGVSKVILKDFYLRPGGTSRVEHTCFDFAALRDMVVPLLLGRRFRVEMAEFVPFRERWLAILERHGVPYVYHPAIRTVIVRAVR